MLIYEDNFKATLSEKTYIALGSFDGLHIGHMSLINKTIELAKANNAKSMVFTFKNHPLTVINNDIAPKLIINNETKTKLLEKAGIDIVNYANFDDIFMKISPEDFIENMLTHYNVKGIIVGFNYRFGYKNLGDIDLLKKLSCKLGFDLKIINPVKINNEVVSSTRIRELISEGDIVKANTFLNRNFVLKGKVIHGKQLGRKINFPTTNLDYDKKFVLPRGGVYYTSVNYNNKKYKGITNIGYNPTVKDEKLSIETHILDFQKEIYDEILEIYFHERIRDEKKFDSIEELANQLTKDKKYALSKNIIEYRL
ncbi:bifunctional riboflavin kinase/FAD synthetase [Clostridium haemolyticum]|uniref:Riboflavin biosynthesis protein n=1 Tax=Clostridium haemolyticum NCTC 9693 TaxID=1443114 RepID=A0ABR4TET3_CLOHA|nr:bifunctional riboflavin kinase/FAD synthetase [Clostridium haemolyticum]KEI17029.1 riboflavin kinase [Clostridium haemolyticum NCTC 9693]KGN01067.1 riboflavin kinase [Clostridium haemolyticum NCTC 8350]OOB76200.1 bifunctional riboflavin kinase/FMN adenylyltransferase [Clostridium haemolyticum]CAG7840730.1 Bifunctional riboflavin kinase/FMN adenylyltransferase [Clostridium haemolyticum]